MTLRGTPFIYAGDEIGMRNGAIPPDRIRDPLEKKMPGFGLGRDPERTPMPWDASPNAGFTSGTPWLPVGSDGTGRTVAGERADGGSILHLYRHLIALRRSEPALVAGRMEPMPSLGNDVLAFHRCDGGTTILIALNLGASERTIALPQPGRLRLSTQLDRTDEALAQTLSLRPDEGVIIALGSA
jgi:alpha-glucosidase